MRKLLLGLLLMIPCKSWAAFTHYSPVTVQAGQVPSAQTDFPMLISYTDNRLRTTGNGGNVQNANGYDIRPHANTSCTSALTYELVFYAATTGQVEMWVKVASIDVGSVVYLCYGDAALSSDGSNSATWSNSFVYVSHLKDGTTLSVVDATGTLSPTNNGATATTGKIDGGAAFASASSQYIKAATAAVTDYPFTISAWFNSADTTTLYALVSISDTATADQQAALVIRGDVAGDPVSAAIRNAGVFNFADTSAGYSSSTWTYATGVFTNSTSRAAYINAGSSGTNSGSVTASGWDATDVGRLGDSTPSTYLNGSLDEVRIANVARSANWITTEYNNQSAPSTFAVLGTEVPIGGVGGGVIGGGVCRGGIC